jgi:chloramphenicol 3-O-phosphotransferase
VVLDGLNVHACDVSWDSLSDCLFYLLGMCFSMGVRVANNTLMALVPLAHALGAGLVRLRELALYK